MRINPSDRSLSILLGTLQEVILPALPAGAARASGEMACAVLVDLLKREHGTPELLRALITEGEQLAGEIAALLPIEPTVGLSIPEQAALQWLLQRHDELGVRLHDLCEELSDTADDHVSVSSMLRKVAQWELSYYQRQAQLPTPELERVPPTGVPLDRDILQAFLSTDGAAVEVTHLEQLTGGFGKQTFLARMCAGQGDESELVVRKMDPTPIMRHGACDLRSEYALLCALVPLDYPAPKPQRFCEDFGGVDGSFYTMDRIAGRTPGDYLSGISGAVDESLFLQLAELMARLHAIPLEHFAGYIRSHDDPRILDGSIEDCYRCNLEGWRRYIRREKHLQSPFLLWLLDWLQHNVPKDARRPLLVHGDFNIHNILVDDGRVTAVLDWECAGFGAPEQDLAYIRPHVSRHIDWHRFVAHYNASGGPCIDDDAMAFGMVYSALRTVLAGNRASGNLQSGANTDIRYAMVELGFMASFMGLALQSAADSREGER